MPAPKIPGLGWLAILVTAGALLLVTPVLWTPATLAQAADSESAASPDQVGDGDIERAIESELYIQSGMDFHDIDIEVVDGVATLSGTVGTLLAKDRAERVTEMVRGVRSVVDLLEVEAPRRSDLEIRADVKEALMVDPATESFEIEPGVEDGRVTLTGEVGSWQEKTLAGKVAKQTRGVTALENHLEVEADHDRADAEIRADIERRLDWDVRLDAPLVDVAVDNGEVRLTGTVGSAAEKRWAEDLAHVVGVVSVDVSGLGVEPWADEDRFRESPSLGEDDAAIAEAIKDAFLYDPRLYSFAPTVYVNDGVATLSGVVGNLQAKRAASQDAWNTTGVWRVENLLKVRPETSSSDEEIAENVRDALREDPWAENYEIGVTVRHGEVDLRGGVDTSFEKRHAETLAASVPGVVAIDNHLTIEAAPGSPADERYPWQRMSEKRETASISEDWEIRQEIQDQLFWSPFVDEEEVQVEVDSGLATLTGTVETWAERQAATENAYEGGAQSVLNKIELEYDGPGA